MGDTTVTRVGGPRRPLWRWIALFAIFLGVTVVLCGLMLAMRSCADERDRRHIHLLPSLRPHSAHHVRPDRPSPSSLRLAPRALGIGGGAEGWTQA